MKYLLYILLFTSQCSWSQLKSYTFEDLSHLKEERPIVIFLHTDWCKYCKVMENITFKNKKVIEALNERFYFISFNAEQKASVTYQNHTFKYRSTGKKTGIHELAEALGAIESKISYPTTIVLNNKKEIVFQYPYVLKPKEYLKILNKIE